MSIVTTERPTAPRRTRTARTVGCSLLCHAHVKRYILDVAKRERAGWPCERVSMEGLDLIEAKLRNMIDDLIHKHRSVGKTFNP